MARFMNKQLVDKEACLSSLDKLDSIEQALDHLDLKERAFCVFIRRALRLKLGAIVEAMEKPI